jgi:HSP20 family protein
MKTLAPPAGIDTLRKEMDRLFDRLWHPDGFELTHIGEWTPDTDFMETNEGFVAKLEVPGIEPKDISVSVHGGVLTIKGEKLQGAEEKKEHFYRMEREYGSFVRSIRLPAPVDEAHVSATFNNGLLTIILPKTVEAKGTTVPIKTI